MEAILIVDDIEQNRYLLQVMLAGLNYTVIEAENGLDALEKARTSPPDLVISDILMPVMDGFALCRQWKSDPQLHQIPFIFYTATYTEPKDKKFALSLGAERFLVKPIEPPELITIIKGILIETRENRHISPVVAGDDHEDHRFYKEYSSVLITKLENKVAELERSNRTLKETITELQSTENRLRLSQILLQSIVDGISEPIILLDHDTTIKMINQAAIDYFGKSTEQVVGRTCQELNQAVCGHCQACEIPERLHLQQASIIERRSCLYPDRFEQVSIYPLCASPDDTGSAIIRIADITESKRLQEHLLQKEKLAAVGELAAGVAHEINNPINGIMNYAQLLIDEHDGKEDDVEFPRRILSEADRVVKIVRNLLSFSRQTDDDVNPVDIRSFLHDALQLMEKQLIGDGITINLDLPDSFPLILGNGHKMQQVFLNVLSNARQALNVRYPEHHPKKSLSIHSTIRKDDDRSWLAIHFVDSGIGIPENIIHRICDPFFTTKDRGEGVGLGLSISYGIIQEHGGKLLFNSVVNVGTTVTVAIPIIKSTEEH